MSNSLTPDRDRARESAFQAFLPIELELTPAQFSWICKVGEQLVIEQRAEEAERCEANRFRGCPDGKHELTDNGVCCNCNFGQRQADLRRQAAEGGGK